jgi:hypothetical protein
MICQGVVAEMLYRLDILLALSSLPAQFEPIDLATYYASSNFRAFQSVVGCVVRNLCPKTAEHIARFNHANE